MTSEEMIQLAKECGFDAMGITEAENLKFMPEVRDMCAAGKCGAYNKSWSCPPAIGTIEDSYKKIKGYQYCLVLQCIAQMEDDFDVEAMQDAGERIRIALEKIVAELKPKMEILSMGCGGCRLCSKCTYPDAPCRFPEKVFPSMEAYGLMVSNVCKKANVPYYHGKNTLAYTCCVLYK